MTRKSIITAALTSLSLAFAAMPSFGVAETLQVMRGAPSSALQVPMNRAVVVESDTPFTELSIANPGIADISSLSDRTIYVLGKEPGRTTLTLLGADGRLITNVEVQVTPDITEFKERLEQILPGETIDIRIDSPADESYTIAPYQHYAVRVEAVAGVSGGTVTTTPE
ncbi:pilus assembly protein N-terminal domain-containing protein, partial [Marivivens sp.]|uniref:pilus assembly protein N-terminal domain-containing protein n=1 Tax=Marivivens sp. TaxID=1978374 RepID=UPI0025C4B0F2